MADLEVTNLDLHIGFTGTRKGMTDAQKEAVRLILIGLGTPAWLHHGWCDGSDAEADEIARPIGYKVIGHPPLDTKYKADLPEPEIMCDPKPYLDRDLDIAIASSILVAAPKGFEEEFRSGTWATIRRGRVHCQFVIVVWPDGSWKLEYTDDADTST